MSLIMQVIHTLLKSHLTIYNFQQAFNKTNVEKIGIFILFSSNQKRIFMHLIEILTWVK
jgi:hypothetical protein